MSVTRRYDIDWLRVLAIGLLIIYHIAIVFQPWAMFIGFVRSNEFLETLWKPMTLLNVWRIPLLFYVSGMGMFFALRKRNWKQLLTERSKRILLPFLFGIIAITPLHMFLFQEFYNIPLDYYAHQGHLWFLGNIFVYVVLFLPVFIWLKKKENSKLHQTLNNWMANPLGPLSIVVFFILEAELVAPQLFSLYAQTWHGFFLGFIAFFFGFLMVYSGQSLWKTLLKWRWMYFVIALVLFVIRFIYFNTEAPGYLTAIESNCWIFTLFGFAYKYLNKPSKKLSYLSTAVYPVYIIHMFVLYLGALVILPLEIAPIFEFILITLFTFIGCFMLYEFVIKRIGVFKMLFGLKWERKVAPKVKEIRIKG